MDTPEVQTFKCSSVFLHREINQAAMFRSVIQLFKLAVLIRAQEVDVEHQIRYTLEPQLMHMAGGA